MCGFEPQQLDKFPSFAPALAGENADYDPSFFELLATLEEGSFWFPARNDLILWALRGFFPAAHSMMEVGVGTGYVLRAVHAALPKLRLCGSDLHVEGLRFASARVGNEIDLIQMDARRMPFRDEFDVIGFFDVLERITEDEAVLTEAFRALKPEGGLILTVPQHMFLWGPADVAACHKRRYGGGELAGKAAAAGFTVLLKTSFVSFPLPLLYLSRLRSKLSGSYDIVKELKLHPWAAVCLRRALGIERDLYGRVSICLWEAANLL
jgi:SAM-dependent methyltransferase